MVELFKIGFLSITLIDILDIAIVAVLFFWLYKALRNTVAIQILMGLVILISLAFITEAIHLKAINWILRTISDIWLIAFIILFQPELRKLLMMITRSPLFKIFVKEKISETIDEVIEAVIELSEKHIGAIIVFTRTQNVKMTVETGIPIKAQVTKELIISIFNPKSPLHDGAIIIDGQMLVAARCILPLSTVTKIKNRNLGTRHRAALGLSEQIDAIVLVVSEETASISLAEGGKFIFDISKEMLPSFLSTKLSEELN